MYSPHSLTHLPTHQWKLRITLSSLIPDTYQSSVEQFANTLQGSYLFSLETGDKTNKLHIQAGFSHETQRPDTIKGILKKYLKFDPEIKKLTNAHWSCTLDEEPLTWPRYLNYLTKEKNYIYTNISNLTLEEMNATYWAENKRILSEQKAITNKNQKAKVLDRADHFQNIIDKIEKEKLLKEMDYLEYEVEVDPRFDHYEGESPPADYQTKRTLSSHHSGKELKDVISLVLDEYKDTYFTLTQLEPTINRIMSRYFPIYWKNQMTDNLINRLIR